MIFRPSNLIALFIFCVIVFGCIGAAAAQTDHALSDHALSVQERQSQRDFIEAFSGARALPDGTYLSGRASRLDRQKAMRFLVAELERRGFAPDLDRYRRRHVRLSWKSVFNRPIGQNIVVTLEATEPSNAYILLGAHYDAERGSPGADDNASGVALLLTLAERLRNASRRECGIIIVLFDQEEPGLFGSSVFAKRLIKRGVTLHSAHIVDMVGWDGDGDRAVELSASAAGTLEQVYRATARHHSIPLRTNNASLADHAPFIDAGFRAILLTEEYAGGDFNPHYHMPSDTADKLDFDYLASTTAFMTDVLKRLLTTSGQQCSTTNDRTLSNTQ